MKYYTIAFPGEFGQSVVETWSEEQILNSYFKYWASKMIESGHGDEVSGERCISDWCVIHWAVETDEFGCQKNTPAECTTDAERTAYCFGWWKALETVRKPCRSPYCECEVGKCTHPGFYDARSETDWEGKQNG